MVLNLDDDVNLLKPIYESTFPQFAIFLLTVCKQNTNESRTLAKQLGEIPCDVPFLTVLLWP